MQEGKNWIFPKEINAKWFFGNSHWLEIWKTLLSFYGTVGCVVRASALVVRPFIGQYSYTS
jgi:hypothetical protein